MAYSEKVIDHYENPRNVGKLDADSDNVGTGMVGAPACGDVMRLQIQVNDEGVIEDAKFKTYGCGSAIASSSLLTEWVKGKKPWPTLAPKCACVDECQCLKGNHGFKVDVAIHDPLVRPSVDKTSQRAMVLNLIPGISKHSLLSQGEYFIWRT